MTTLQIITAIALWCGPVAVSRTAKDVQQCRDFMFACYKESGFHSLTCFENLKVYK